MADAERQEEQSAQQQQQQQQETDREQKAEQKPEKAADKAPEQTAPSKEAEKKQQPPQQQPQQQQQQQQHQTVPQSSRADSKSQRDKSEFSDGRSRQKEFFKEELRRLEGGLKRESSKIVPPSRRKYTPFIFNTLEPYYNTQTTRFLIELPEEQFHTYSSRNTATGLCDPWIDLRMDQELLPHISSRPTTRHDTAGGRSTKRGGQKKGEQPNRKEGSTRLPKFPVVNLETKELATKQLYYSDVPMLRKELKSKYSSQAKQKVDADYKRTQQDFYRMDLDRMEQVAPVNRRHLTSTYMAYLQNTPGSRRAVSECVQRLGVAGKAN